jgi:outer membrane protein assembly factor BamA
MMRLLLVICLLSTALLGLPATPVAGADREVQPDSTATREPVPYERSAGEKWAAVPGDILMLPVRLVQGIAALTIALYETPTAQYLLSFDTPRLYGAYPIASYGANSGFKLGVVLYDNRLFTPEDRLKLRLSYTTHRYQHYALYYRGPRVLGPHAGLDGLARYRKRPRETFYGIGQDSREEAEVNYTLEESYFMGDFQVYATSRVTLTARASFTASNISDGQDPDELGDLDSIRALFGVGPQATRPTRFVSLGTELGGDWRDSKGQPSRGGEAYLRFAYNQGTGRSDRLRFYHASADLRYYLNLFRKRILAFRLLLESRETASGSPPLPFYLLSSLGGRQTLRGYDNNRLMDNDAALFTVEYRYPIWNIIDAFIFYEEGRVFPKLRRDFTFAGWRYSAGGGLRVWRRSGVVFHTQIAFSAETTRFYFELGTDF